MVPIDGIDVMFPRYGQVRSVKSIVRNVTLLNDCIVAFRFVYCLIADNSCSFGSIVRTVLLLFVRVLANILLLIIILE